MHTREQAESSDRSKIVVEFFTGQLYELARDAIITYEITAQEGAEQHWIELRDAVEDIRQALLASTEQDAVRHIATANEHVRRAAVEATQDKAEAQLESVMKALKYYWIKQILYVDLPRRDWVDGHVRGISKAIRDGRKFKARDDLIKSSIESFDRAHIESQNLLLVIRPSTKRRWLLITSSVVVAAFALIGLIASILEIINAF